MANPEHVAKLQEGPTIWNSWRKANLDTDEYLSGADLSGADFRNANLMGADLLVADLREAYLSGANLSGADLWGADLREADLRQADFRNANLMGANLMGADLLVADLREAYLSGANLRGADLRGADLRGADLSGTILSKADLNGADLTNSDLSFCTLVFADLTKATLNGAKLDHANLSGWKISGVVCTHIVRGDKNEVVKFEPLEFEKKYTQIYQLSEMILKIPLSESAYYIGKFIAQSINNVVGSTVINFKTLDAISDAETRFVFTIFDADFLKEQKDLFETVLENKLNEYLSNQSTSDQLELPLDVMQYATNGIIKTGDTVPIVGTPWKVDIKIIQDKLIKHYLYLGKFGEDVQKIIYSIFK